MKFIDEEEYHVISDEQFKAMVVFPDRDAIYLKCEENEVMSREAVCAFLNENYVPFKNIRISYNKKVENLKVN